MTHTAHIGRIGALILAVLTTGAPAFAQIDLSGEWSVVRAEDNVGNTELGDWVGIPMNDASRLSLDGVGRVDPDASRVAVPSARQRLYLTRSLCTEDLEGRRSGVARDDRVAP